MSQIALSTTVGQIVAQQPHLARVFEGLKIDYCCGGKKTLASVCESRGFDPEAVLERLRDPQAAERGSPEATDWTTAPLAALCENIERMHHDYLRRELPRLTGLIAKVVHAHGDNDPKLAAVQSTFSALRAELEPHMVKEECVLFPSIRYLEHHSQAANFPFGSLSNPIRVMVDDHDHAGEALESLRDLTGGYLPPADACNTYRVMLDSLAALERDLHQHVHKENNILFPRAIELETRLGGATEQTAAVGCGCSSHKTA